MAKVYVQYRFGEEPVEVFDTDKSERFNDRSPSRKSGQVGRSGDANEAARSYAKKLRGQMPCNTVIEGDAAEPAKKEEPAKPK